MITIIANELLESNQYTLYRGGVAIEAYRILVPREGTTTIIGNPKRHVFSPYDIKSQDDEVLVFENLEFFTMYCAFKGNPPIQDIWFEDKGEGAEPMFPDEFSDVYALKQAMRLENAYQGCNLCLRLAKPIRKPEVL